MLSGSIQHRGGVAARMDEDEYRTESEVEVDSDHDDNEAEQHLGAWLGHHRHYSSGFEAEDTGTVRRRNKTVVTPKMAMESFRLSFLNSDENQDVNFDAILGELCELESQLNTTQSELSSSLGCPPPPPPITLPMDCGSPQPSSDIVQAELDALAAEITQGLGYHNSVRLQEGTMGVGENPYEAGETDSAFSDNTSLPSSESYTSMVTVSSSAETTSSSSGDTCSTSSAFSSLNPSNPDVHDMMAMLLHYTQQLHLDVLSPEEQKARLKAEKIRIALEKIKEAKIRKLFVRAFAKDGSSKSILVDEKMSVGQVCCLLAEKNHLLMTPDMAVIEHMPELFMERILEDHDSLVENMVMWTRDSKNKVLFEERTEKYDIFRCPEKYLLGGSSAEKGTSLGPKNRERLLQEFFSGQGPGVPEVEGTLYLKSDGKKAWKKYFFVLRASGLYYSPKGKVSKASKDLCCLVQFDFVDVYYGLGWKKKYHAPTDFCFALKHPQIQKKTSKYIRYFCAESRVALDQWIMGIRLAKYGKQIQLNQEKLIEEIACWDERDPSSNSQPTDLPQLKPSLGESRLSLPEPGSRHSIITVRGPVVGNSSPGSQSGPLERRESLDLDVVTPIPQRKSSLSGQSASSDGSHCQPKTPVKRVSFSTTHCVISAESGEEVVPIRHRDSITSASTDSSEDSTSSGEGRHTLHNHKSKLRARLPVTTETTRQISEMCQLSYDDGSFIEDRKSGVFDDRRHTPIYQSLPERRRSSASSTGSDKERRLSERGSRGSVPNSPMSPPPQRHPSDSSTASSSSIASTVRRASPPPLLHQGMEPASPLQDMSHPMPGNELPPPPIHLMDAPHGNRGPPPPPPVVPVATAASSLPTVNGGHSQSHAGHQAEPAEMSIPSPTTVHHHASKPAQGHGPSGIPRPPSSHGRGPPPPPPAGVQPAVKPGTPAPSGGHKSAAPATSPKPPNPYTSANGNIAMPPFPPGVDQRIPGHPPPVLPKSPVPPSGLPQATRANAEGTSGSPARTSIMTPPSSQPGSVVKPTPQKAPKPPNPNQSAVYASGHFNGAQTPMPNSPTPHVTAHPQTLPQQQNVHHVKHPSCAPPLTIPTSKTPPHPPGVHRSNSGEPRSPAPSGGESSPQSPLPFLAELSQKSRAVSSGLGSPGNLSASTPPPPMGNHMGHTAESGTGSTVPMASNHRRSASAGSVTKQSGIPVASKPEGRRAPPPPPPKRSEHTRLSSDSVRQVRVEPFHGDTRSPTPANHGPQSPQTTPNLKSAHPVEERDPIYENCEGLMDINDLPLPPPDMLVGLPMSEQQQMMQGMGASGKKPKPPPPPPKRSRETQLTQH